MQADILGNRAGEQENILRHGRNLAAQRAQITRLDIRAVNPNRALLRVIQPVQQVDRRGFAAAGMPDNGDFFAGLNRERDVFHDRMPRRVGERDVFEADFAAQFGGQRRGVRRVRNRDGAV